MLARLHDFIDVCVRKAAARFADAASQRQRSSDAHLRDIAVQLASEKHKLATLVRNSPASVALLSAPDLRFELVNPAFRAHLANREVIGKLFEEALPELKVQPYLRLLKQVLRTGIPYTERNARVMLQKVPNGQLEETFWDIAFIRIDNVSGAPSAVYLHAYDVTNPVLSRRQLLDTQQELQRLLDSLREEEDLRDRYISALTHDLRTPLTAAKLTAGLIERRTSDVKMLNFAHRIERNMGRADRLIQNLLDASRLKAGEQLHLSLRPFDCKGFMADAFIEIQELYGDRFQLCDVCAVNVHWDADAIRRVLENLCSNALKYGRPDSKVRLGAQKWREGVELWVHNVGEPIPDEERQTLFEPFARTLNAVKGGQKGWGIGLNVVRGIAAAHGGFALCESTADKGTTFRIRLPSMAPVIDAVECSDEQTNFDENLGEADD